MPPARTPRPHALAAAALSFAWLADVRDAGAQQHDAPATRAVPAVSRGRIRTPFGVGERLEYDVKFGAVRVGNGAMEVVGTETIRGRTTWHTVFSVRGGTLFYKVHDRYESWFDVASFSSMRFRQDIDEGSYERRRTFEMFPERAMYREDEKPEQPSVPDPLDDGSFLYFVRTIPLEVGQTYTFERYFKPDRNPVTIKVLRREQVKVPAGTVDAIVIQPIIKTKGIFSEGGQAEVWIADDSTRAMLQFKSKLKFGSLNLYLRSIRPASAAGEVPPTGR
jgi:hypothetical protein